MASRDIANMHLFLDLKKKFPDLPEDLLRSHVPLFSEDQEKCIRLLQREKSQNHQHRLSGQPFSDFRLPENNARWNEDAACSVPMDFGSGPRPAPRPEPRSAPVLHSGREPFADMYRQNSSQDDSYHLPSETMFSTTKEHKMNLPESRMDDTQEQSGRHTVRLSIVPSLPYQQQQQRSAYAGMSHSSRPGRHTTSVNFQLQPRSSLDQRPFVISTIPANVADPSRSGSHVQISVGSRGATFTALRFQHSSSESVTSQAQNSYLFSGKSPNAGAPSKCSGAEYHHPAQASPTYILAVKNEQIARLDLILEVLEKEKALCSQLRAKVSELERMVDNRSSFSSYAEKLREVREENKGLRIECNCLSIETDMYDSSEIPPYDTEDFYTHIFTGPNAPPPNTTTDSAKNEPGARQNCHERNVDEDDEEKTRWICKKCTFANFPGLEECEMCEMPKDTDSFFGGN